MNNRNVSLLLLIGLLMRDMNKDEADATHKYVQTLFSKSSSDSGSSHVLKEPDSLADLAKPPETEDLHNDCWHCKKGYKTGLEKAIEICKGSQETGKGCDFCVGCTEIGSTDERCELLSKLRAELEKIR